MVDNSLKVIEDLNIKSLIHEIQGKQVLLDSDVARLYDYETKYIIRAMKRNIERFPIDFCFQLNEEENKEFLRCQNGTLEIATDDNRGRHRKYLPYVFTEQGIAMLSGLLKNEIAVSVSIKIMNAFVEMRRFIMINGNLFERVITIENIISNKFLEHDRKIEELFDALQNEKKFSQKIFFKDQIYDAYSLVVEIINRAKKDIIIIDNYIDKTTLDLLSKKRNTVSNITIITNENNLELTSLDISKFNKQYPVLKVKHSNDYHDRFIIIDKKELYHCGASLKDLGKKTFGITKIENDALIKDLLKHT
jgi:ORF6N domain.